MLHILDRYLIREIVSSMLGVILVLMVILLGNTSLRILSKIVEGSLPDSALMPMIAINMVHYLTILLPLSIYLGILLAMGRLYKDSEMSALSACGIGPKHIYKSILTVALPIMLLASWLSLYAAPWVSSVRQTIKHEAEQRSELSTIVAGRFNESKSGKGGMLFIESLSEDKTRMSNVFLHSKNLEQQQNITTIETASAARQTYKAPDNKKYMIFEQGYLYSLNNETAETRIIEFEEHGVELKEKRGNPVNYKVSAIPSNKLWGSNKLELSAELQWRFSVPLACLLLAMLAYPLSYTTPRAGRYSRLALGILVYMIYTNILGIARTLIERDKVPLWLGMNWVHLLVILLIFLLLKKSVSGGFLKRLHFSGIFRTSQ